VLKLASLDVAALWAAPAVAPVWRPAAAAFRIERSLAERQGIALTFDDGPDPAGTPAVLAALAAAGATATFFLVGEQVERFPEIARAIADAGHEIALHGYRHTLLLRRSPGALADDLARAATLIEDVTGQRPRLYRPPYGVFSYAGLQLAREHWQPLLWSRWGCEWRRSATPRSVARRVTRDLEPGDVVLLHDANHYSAGKAWQNVVAALPAVFEAAQALGEPLVRVTRTQST
jgi:peptidoglycan/xylan/chitin deacetylase (PgdA/CDA1 family)